MTALLLFVSMVLIVAGALLFTNAVEWLGERLNLGSGAVGSVLAAVGTALPESVIPVVALLSGGENQEVAIGAVIGAPFMLTTVAMVLVAASVLVFRKRRDHGRRLNVDYATTRRDLLFFLPALVLALLLGLGVAAPIQIAGAVALVAAYVVYLVRTIRGGGEGEGEEGLQALVFDRKREGGPRNWRIAVQFLVGLMVIIAGAELFVEELKQVASSLGASPLILALVLAPVATELPEKANSILWVRRGEDSLALGNISGAMTFQSTIPVAALLVLLPWDLDKFALAAGAVAVVGGVLVLVAVRRGQIGVPLTAAWSALFAGFVVFAVLGAPAAAPAPPPASPATTPAPPPAPPAPVSSLGAL